MIRSSSTQKGLASSEICGISIIVNLVANGMTRDETIREYPVLKPEDIKEALQYAAWLSKEELHPAVGAEK